MKKEFFIYSLLVLFLLGVAYIVLTLSAGRTSFFGKASGSGVFNSANSYIFASPLTVKAGAEKIRLTVFALDGQGRGIANKGVVVNCRPAASCTAAGVVFSDIQPQTDTMGQAIFDLSGRDPGKYEVEALVEGVNIPQTVTVTLQ